MNRTSFFTPLFEPRTIAFVGASANPAKWGFNILHHLTRGNYGGEIFAIHPQGGTWFGRPLYRRLADVPAPIDLAVIVVPKEKVPGAGTSARRRYRGRPNQVPPWGWIAKISPP
jgi:acyl-CoA synthetase (NDP forming)